MELPLVTVVTPSLNQGRFLRATIESVLSQDYPRLEYIIMDGGSTDETARIARDYSNRLTFVSEPDQGQSDAINKGFRKAQGSIVAWLNSDDVFLDGAVTYAVQALKEAPEAGAVYGEGYRIGEDGQRLGRFPFTEPFNLWKLTHLLDYVLQQTLFLRKPVLDQIGYLDEALHYTMDWDLLIRIGKLYPIRYIPRYMACIREYASAKSFAGGRERIREIRRMLQRHTALTNPPGAKLYALEQRRRWWNASIVGRRAERIRHESQGLYRDGWAAPRMRYMLPRGEGEIVISGVSPIEQNLTVVCNSQEACQSPAGIGSFEVRFPASGVARIEMSASGWTRAASSDRKVSYVLKRIAWANPKIL